MTGTGSTSSGTPTRPTILIGYTPTPEGTAALARATLEAKHQDAHLAVLNTGKDGNYNDPIFATEQDIDAVDAQLTEANISHSIIRPNNDLSAADSILNAAHDLAADLIVIGLRRRSPVGKLITGSTAQEVLLGADCPVLTVKAHGGSCAVAE